MYIGLLLKIHGPSVHKHVTVYQMVKKLWSIAIQGFVEIYMGIYFKQVSEKSLAPLKFKFTPLYFN